MSTLALSQLLAQDDAPTPTPTPVAKHPKHGSHISSTTPSPTKTKPPIADSSSADDSDGPGFDGVAYVDKKLGSLITVQKVNNELSPMKLLTVYVDIQNKTHKPLELQVQTMYEDTSKNLVSSDDSWIDFPLKPRETQEYCSVALSQDARSYLVRIRLEPADGNTNTGPGNGEGLTQITPTPTAPPVDGATPAPVAIQAINPTPSPIDAPTPQPTPKPVVVHRPKLLDPSTLP